MPSLLPSSFCCLSRFKRRHVSSVDRALDLCSRCCGLKSRQAQLIERWTCCSGCCGLKCRPGLEMITDSGKVCSVQINMSLGGISVCSVISGACEDCRLTSLLRNSPPRERERERRDSRQVTLDARGGRGYAVFRG